MKIQQLRFLVAAVDYGSILNASKRLHLSQPSITAGIKALESELGGAIFDRSGPPNKPRQLTPEGQRFYRRALQILDMCDTALEEFSAQGGKTKRLRLGILETLPTSLVSGAIEDLTASEGGLDLIVWEGAEKRLEHWLERSRIDIAWTVIQSSDPDSLPIWEEPLVAVCSQELYESNRLTSISINDLSKLPFVHRSNCELDGIGRQRLRTKGVKLDVRIRAERDDIAFDWIRRSRGITLAPSSLVPADLVSVEVHDLGISRTIGLKPSTAHHANESGDVMESIRKVQGKSSTPFLRPAN